MSTFSGLGINPMRMDSDDSLTEKDALNLRIEQLERDKEELEAMVSKLKLQAVKFKRRYVKQTTEASIGCTLITDASMPQLRAKIAELERELESERLSSQLLR